MATGGCVVEIDDIDDIDELVDGESEGEELAPAEELVPTDELEALGPDGEPIIGGGASCPGGCNNPGPCHTGPGLCGPGGTCIYPKVPEGTSCDDGIECTEAECTRSGVCVTLPGYVC